MDVSQMSEEEQLQAAMQLSMQDISGSGSARPPGGGAAGGGGTPLRLPGQATQRGFPGKDPHDALAAPSLASSAKKQRGEPRAGPAGTEVRLSAQEAADLIRLLFGDRPEAPDVERWLNIGFQFSAAQGAEWGLWQRHGGPCGVFAPVQALIVKQLLFGEAGSENAAADVAKRREQPLAAGGGAEEEARAAFLAHALASVLYSTTPTSSYVVCQVALPEGAGDSSSAASSAAASIVAGTSNLRITGTRVARVAEAQQLFEEGTDTWLSGPCGVVSFICSVLLSRTQTMVKEDMDDPATPLIGRFGHCSQELVNLMLIGEATSNVFDGSRWLGDDPSSGLLVKGVDGDRVGVPTCGFLSELEPMRYVSVGSLYKNPEFPVWVLGSPTHYTLLFSTQKADSQLSHEAQVEQRAKKVFMESSIDEGGLAMASSLEKLLTGLGVEAGSAEQTQAQSELIREEIILWDDFRSWARKKFGVTDGPSANDAASKKLDLFLYDGQDPPGPSLRAVTLELNDIDPQFAGGESDTFAAMLHTRWPNAVVAVRTVAGAAGA